jgi:soluble lytic murein transglycosylase
MLPKMFSCIFRNSRTVLVCCLLSLGPLVAAATESEEAPSQISDRDKFKLAVKELRTGAGPRYQSLRRALDHYPLALYLDALVIEGNLHYGKPENVTAFLQAAGKSPIAMRTLRSFVRHKMEDRRWGAVVEVTEGLTLSTELICHRAHALLMRGETAEATPLLNRVWTVGKSQIKACDPAFKTWYRKSGPSDDVVWSRALKAADARNSTLLRYLNRFASAELKPSLDDLGEIYRRPDRVTRKSRGSLTHQRDIAHMGVKRLAKVNPKRALDAMQALSKRFEFDAAQQTLMNGLIVRHSLFAKSAAPWNWVTSRLAELRDDELTEIYLRSTIAKADWPSFRTGYEWLSASRQTSDEWRYWRVMAAAPGEAERSEAELNALAAGRGFHAYLAAEILSLPPSLARDEIVASPTPSSSTVARVRELIAVGMTWEARSEFRAALDEPAVALSLAKLAAESEWHSLAIEAAAAAQAWGLVDVRFPVVYESEFANASVESGLDIEELFAVARRESAMASDAISEVGARGLMQLMPSTARLTARKHNYRYSRSRLMRPGYNTAVGALYYADLIKQYDGNRVLALAAYNAGPNRVRRWSEGNMSVARWVDTIPFKETREYVRAVLAYNVIYRLKSGKPAEMLSESERDYLY